MQYRTGIPVATAGQGQRRSARHGAGTAAIVRPYSTGRYLASRFGARGWAVVAVVPHDPLELEDHARSFRAGDYDAVVTGTGDTAATARQLARYGVSAVIPGCETSVEWADAIAAELGLPGNNPATSANRRDKGAMAAALAKAGIRGPQTIRVRSAGEACCAAADIGGRVVLKPVASAGSDSVTVCDSVAQVSAAWDAAAGKTNRMGLPNTEMIVQEYLVPVVPGQQVMVNTVTVPGAGGEPVHYVAEVWQDNRRELAGGRTVYDWLELLDGDDPVTLEAGEYAGQVLDAVGVEIGAGHSEVMMTSDGPALIETAARLCGAGSPSVTAAALGQSQVGLTVEAMIDPEGFACRYQGPYRRRAHVVMVCLIAPGDGVLDAGMFSRIQALPSVMDWLGHVSPGGEVTRTVDYFTCPGVFYLASVSREQVAADAAMIRELEMTGLYG